MELTNIRKKAKNRLAEFCSSCWECNGEVCRGQVPGMGGVGTGRSFINNFRALNMYQLNLRSMHQAISPETELILFGERIATPILPAPIGGMNVNFNNVISEKEYADSVSYGAKQAGTISTCGDGSLDEVFESGLQSFQKAGVPGIAMIKPRSVEGIINRIRQAEESGAIAVGVDVDACAFNMAEKGAPVGPKSFYQMRRIVQSTSLPFIIKGVMTVQEAEMAVEMGAAGIVVSNHGGRALDYTPGTAEVLPEIAEKVKGEIVIMVDGGIRSGIDVLKVLALGAEFVLVGRPVLHGVFADYNNGVSTVLEQMTSELRRTMMLTGCAHVKAIDERVIY
ncbi:alpha-hydroxy-acid oxidizing protein [Natranaerobius thermophilus]|uniref:L-lactate oxidase n=1 Tax=Natranaerobius thermophilus (strain ATCC BAA-1301 / DSM 18059 / JW/NM-WN-LF) TaxID=457570 RepID=B2A707_NATTJ|nr:alpha-hydroxy-acid oxidizing protein [Natranaerobius thermophilus]ACB85598.1 FMN-dependent alpha-hydroxy acid dehydrogenase [Natranaerobius thermophilus JW/NM-WN-LF]